MHGGADVQPNHLCEHRTAGFPGRLAIDPDGDTLTCKWKQFTGLPWVPLTGDTTTNCSFTAPAIKTTLAFRFIANDGDEEDSITCTVYVGY